MTSFEVKGPFDVPVYRGKAGRIIRADEGAAFFNHHPSLADKLGCYVFGMRAGRGITPIYVGQTRRNFGNECFEPHKCGKYNQCLADYARGTPVLFFAVLPSRRGPRNRTHIDMLETFLIQTAVGVNPDLLNVRGTKGEEWGITGVLRAGRGRPSEAASAFKKMMGS